MLSFRWISFLVFAPECAGSGARAAAGTAACCRSAFACSRCALAPSPVLAARESTAVSGRPARRSSRSTPPFPAASKSPAHHWLASAAKVAVARAALCRRLSSFAARTANELVAEMTLVASVDGTAQMPPTNYWQSS